MIKKITRYFKAIRYNKKIRTLRAHTNTNNNYECAKSVFVGFFGNITYECKPLMMVYKDLDKEIDIKTFLKVQDILYTFGQELYCSTNDQGHLVVGFSPSRPVRMLLTNNHYNIEHSSEILTHLNQKV